jgi:hypothetical protein
MKLENLAADKFIEYAFKQTGKTVNWRYLSDERKLAWIREFVDIYIMVIDQIEPLLKLKPSGLGMVTSHERAWSQGENFENFRCTSLISNLKTEIEEQYNKLQEDYASTKR